MFITIDGGDGAGKGRQVEFLQSWFDECGIDYEFFRDPGDTILGEAIRNILLDRSDLDICSSAELALFMASRAQLIHEKIRPALASGKIVLVDRFILSTAVYQGYAVGANDDEIAFIWDLGKRVVSGVLPDITFVLDCPTDVAFQRLNRTMDRIESKGRDFHRRVADGYRKVVRNWEKYASGSAYLIDATLRPDEVFAKIKAILAPKIGF